MLPFNEKKRLEWLMRCEEQLSIYIYGKHSTRNCPICKNTPCNQCLWVLLENTVCRAYAECIFPTNSSAGDIIMETEEWSQFRVPHLRGWINRLRYGKPTKD